MSVYEIDTPGDGGVGGGIGGGGGGGTPPGGGGVGTPTPTPSPVTGPPPPDTSAILPAIIASSVRGGFGITVSRIPLVAVPAQTLAVQLGTQSCRINVRQKSTGLYLDLLVSDRLIAAGILCHDRVWLIRDAYLGFTGDLAFVDTQGNADPDYTGLADRFQLLWGR